MKKNLFFAVAIMAAMLFTSCITVCHDPYNPLDRAGEVAFTATVGGLQTRVVGQTWTANDAIGIFAIEHDTPPPALSTGVIFNNHSNVRFHTAATNGNFRATNPAEAIIFPLLPDALDFIAYYPYRATLTNFTFPVNVADQTTQTLQSALDLLWVRTNDHDGGTPIVPLEFGRRMSLLELTITAGTGITDLTGLTVEVEGLRTNGTMNLVNGIVTPNGTAGTIDALVDVAGSNTTATATAILIPTQNLNNATVRFTLGTLEFEWSPPNETLGMGMKYVYSFTLSGDPLPRLTPDGAIIGPWLPGNTPGGQIPLDPIPLFRTDAVDNTVSLAEGSGETFSVALEAPGIDWNITIEGNPWLQVSPISGTGNETITFTTLQANTGGERLAIVTIADDNSELQPIVIRVTQAKYSNATQSLVFNETFGTSAQSGTPLLWPTIGDFTGFVTTGFNNNQQAVTFTAGVGGRVDVRTNQVSIGSGGANVMFSANDGGTLYIDNIYVCGTRNLLLSFATNRESSEISVAYRADGTGDWSSPLLFDKTTTTWGWVNDLPIHLPAGANTVSLRFTAGNTPMGARIDDVTIITYDTPNGGC